MYISRNIEQSVRDSLADNPVTAIIGPRQCGKSTLARYILKEFEKKVFLDLERPSDLAKLESPELFLESQKGKLICLDEIQRKPEIFPLIRSLVDDWGGSGHFLILGSASAEMLKQSSESLAGRISYKTLTPFLFEELSSKMLLNDYMWKGGYPRSILAGSDRASYSWREDMIRSYVERDLLQWAGVSSVTVLRLWKMLAHLNGQTINHSRLSNSLGVSSVTVRNHMDLLTSTFMLVPILPYLPNLGKRLIRNSKVYISDPGLVCALLEIRSFEQLLANPVFGSVWELVVLSQIRGKYPSSELFHYRTSHGDEIDFILRYNNKLFAIECKASASPSLTKGNYRCINDLKPDQTLIVAPVSSGWKVKSGITVVNQDELLEQLSDYFRLATH
ncbi:MAG: ATP-binding protein [Bacteroidales bacterium]|nr:ATP-binding protein [Bacteroidales bacterium]